MTVNGSPAIVRLAERGGPAVGATVNETAPDPVLFPLPAVSVIQSTLFETDHGHDAPAAVTATLPVPPSAPVWYPVGLSVNEQSPAWRDWVMVNRWPATVIPPVRGGPVVAATSKFTTPAPVPFAAPRIVIQSASATAVHAQSALEALTSTRPDPPPRSKLPESGAREIVHSPAACMTSARWLLARIAPRRTSGSGLATASN